VPTAVGIPKEIKDREGRVSMQPDAVVDELHHGREAIVQSGASKDSGFSGEEYESAGGRVVESTGEIFEAADLIVNVKEPIPEEYDRFREEQELFTYLHLAADRELPEILIERKIDALAYEAVELPEGSLPLLAPMSEVAGRISVQAAAQHLESTQGWAGLLPGGNLVFEPVAEAHDVPHTSQERVLG
jgi:alanine dehydrogenase